MRSSNIHKIKIAKGDYNISQLLKEISCFHFDESTIRIMFRMGKISFDHSSIGDLNQKLKVNGKHVLFYDNHYVNLSVGV